MGKEEQQRVKALIKETITLLCKNGLKYKSEFCIEATIGITVDQDDILLVSMNETIKSELALSLAAALESPSQTDGRGQSPSHRSHRRFKRRHTGQMSPSSVSDRRDSSYDGDSMDSGGLGSGTPASGYSEDMGQGIKRQDRRDQEDSKSDIVCIEIKEEPEDFDTSQTESSYLSASNLSASRQQTSELPGFPPSDLHFSSDLSHMAGEPPSSSSGGVGSDNRGSLVPSSVPNSRTMGPWSHPSGTPSAASGSSFSMADMSGSEQQDSQLGASFQSQDGQQEQTRVPHSPSKGHRTCPLCAKSFTTTYGLKDHHRRIHLGQFKYRCEVCGKGFASTTNLHGHMTVHTNRKEFKCSVCSAEFIYRQMLKLHVISQHSGE